MRKLVFLSVSILLFLSGCGGDPAPEKNSMAAMRAKLEAGHKERFSRHGSSVKIEKSDKKRIDDPNAYVYKGKILTNEEEKEWKKAGISNTEYTQWATLDMKPKDVSQWKDLNISYSAISVFSKQNYTPETASKLMQKKFFARPNFYAQFGTPVYEFDSICQGVIARQQPPFAFLEERCLPYMEASHKNEAIGHLLDEAKLTKGPLALEYLAELRNLATENKKIQSGMEVTIEEFIEDEDTDNFVYLFPLLQNEPTQDEMIFIDENKLPLENEERFSSFQNPQYWQHRAETIKAANLAAERQEALLRAKKSNERKEALAQLAQAQADVREKELQQKLYKQKDQARKKEAARRIKAKELCGEMLNAEQYSGKQALIEGEVIFIVGETGHKRFGYGIKAREDGKIYFIRDPKNLARTQIGKTISWKLKTMGRTEALSKQEETIYSYDSKSTTKFTMALFVKECTVK